MLPDILYIQPEKSIMSHLVIDIQKGTKNESDIWSAIFYLLNLINHIIILCKYLELNLVSWYAFIVRQKCHDSEANWGHFFPHDLISRNTGGGGGRGATETQDLNECTYEPESIW